MLNTSKHVINTRKNYVFLASFNVLHLPSRRHGRAAAAGALTPLLLVLLLLSRLPTGRIALLRDIHTNTSTNLIRDHVFYIISNCFKMGYFNLKRFGTIFENVIFCNFFELLNFGRALRCPPVVPHRLLDNFWKFHCLFFFICVSPSIIIHCDCLLGATSNTTILLLRLLLLLLVLLLLLLLVRPTTYLVPTTSHLLPTARHLLPTTWYLLPTTCIFFYCFYYRRYY